MGHQSDECAKAFCYRCSGSGHGVKNCSVRKVWVKKGADPSRVISVPPLPGTKSSKSFKQVWVRKEGNYSASVPESDMFGKRAIFNQPDSPSGGHDSHYGSMMQYEGPSMLDGVVPADNISDDALEAWNEHVYEVEMAAEQLMFGSLFLNGLIFVRARGEQQRLDVLFFPSFLHFLGWMTCQVFTRRILPAGPSDSVHGLTIIGAQSRTYAVNIPDGSLLEGLIHGMGQLYNVVLWVTNDLYLHMMSLDFVQPMPPHVSPLSATRSAFLTELEDEVVSAGQFAPLASDGDTSLTHGVGDLLPPDDHVNSILYSFVGTDDAGESSSSAAVVPAARRRGRPKKVAAPLTVSEVRRSPRNHNAGYNHTGPSDGTSCHRSSSVPAATIPAVLQISEMQRLGIEECHIDPEELSEEHLRQEHQDRQD
ncbi:hypothetical protein ACQ4PT_033663 [Festuca glaucescens]